MMHYSDERRDGHEFDHWTTTGSDPEVRDDLNPRERRFKAAIDALEADRLEQEARLKALQTRLDTSEKQLRRQTAKRAEAEQQRRRLRDQLAVRGQELKEARRVEIRLRAELTRVRHSRSFVLGKTLLTPARLAKAWIRSVGGQELAVESAGGATTETIPPTPQMVGGDVRSSSAPASRPRDPQQSSQETPVAQRSLTVLQEEFEADQTPVSFLRLVYRYWFTHGDLTKACALIEQHPELVSAQNQRDRNTLRGILGEARVPRLLDHVPPAGLDPVFDPEAGRVMYCVHSTPVFHSNGYSTRTGGVAIGLLRAGADVVVVARSGYPWDSLNTGRPPVQRHVVVHDDVEYVHLPGAGLGKVPVDRYILEAADAYVREALLRRPSLIQAASNHRNALAALIAARRVGVPFVYEIRGLWEMSQAIAKPEWADSEHYQLLGKMEIEVAQRADHVFAITRQVKDYLIDSGVPAERISVTPNAVDTDEFLPLPKDTQYAQSRGIRTDVPVLGFAGSMVSYEGLELLLRASAKLKDRGIDHQVVLAGSGSDEPSLRKLAVSLNPGGIVFLGRLPIEEMPRLLSTFDIMPIPRISAPVTEMVSPLKPLEAFGSAKAVVLSDVAPHRDLAGYDESRALTFRAGSVDSLVEVLTRLIADTDLRAELGRAARLWCLDERTWPTVGTLMTEGHRVARETNRRAAGETVGNQHRRLRVGIIADEFTTATLEPSLDLVVLERDRWQDQLRDEGLDLFFLESAWKGNQGQWSRTVGDYGPEEHGDIVELLTECREQGIPSVFWNKEDPVHFERFRSTAALCDHVFTTDANLIQKYFATNGAETLTVSSLPFYAQPLIHNPLTTARPYEASIAYAGTYYGDRYKERSKVLGELLDAAAPYGLTIYDRQADDPNSPYRFPERFAPYSRGTIPYREVLDSYKSHLAHLNVNSVINSPTMFSRRVVEIAACGGVVLSGPGRGVEETFNGMIPVTGGPGASRHDALLQAIAGDPTTRVAEAWRQLRAVHRSHTINSTLALVSRIAGVPVAFHRHDPYQVVCSQLTDAVVTSILRQSVRPTAVVCPDGGTLAEDLTAAGITVLDSVDELPDDAWVASVAGDEGRTFFEDLLVATSFGDWDAIGFREATSDDVGATLASTGPDPRAVVVLRRAGKHHAQDEAAETIADDRVVTMLLPPIRTVTPPVPARDMSAPRTVTRQKILVAGHDLKFAEAFIKALEAEGHTVLVDQWQGHAQHDEATSLDLLKRADVIWCEWGLGNLEWYSRHVRPHQRLVARVHSQELFVPYLRRVRHENVDQYVFVGELIRRAAVTSHGVPAERTVVIPNPVDTRGLDLPKLPGAEYNLGMVGVVPRGKRLDRAVELIERLVDRDDRYRLHVKGRLPKDYPWMANRPDEMTYYAAVFDRIEALNRRLPGCVTFDPHGDDMPQWFTKIGVAISVSDFESFHFTIADGAASGAMPVSLAWAGADLIYPHDWLCVDIDGMAQRIVEQHDHPRDEAVVIRQRFDREVVTDRFLRTLCE